MTNGFALNPAKTLQIYFFWVKSQAKNDFPKDVERSVGHNSLLMECNKSKFFPLLVDSFFR